jgi:LytS/YehU family sensor histidine kinase
MEEPEKAVTYVNELSSVYRYLLQANENNLITIEKELNFLKDYFHLLETRFGNGVQLSINLNDRYLNWLLPPLTLQLLVENAVKHNTVLPQKPLLIQIYNEDDNIVVINNLQKKTSHIPSSKLGLKTIRSKYELIKKEAIQIEETQEYFKVTLPLIKNNIYETAGS